MKRPRIFPEYWASLKPFGIGEQHPNNYFEMVKAVVDNRDQLPYALRILTQGVCDGCALGTSGVTDWTLKGIHLCNIRLRLLRLNTMPAFDVSILEDVHELAQKKNSELRELGRLPYPMLRRRGEAGFRRISWDEANSLMVERYKSSPAERSAFFLTSRGMPNESYYAAQKAVRAIGNSNIDNASRICHSPSSVALKSGLGIAASSCSYSDWIKSDLLVFFGSNPANNQPVTTKYLHYAKKAGVKVASVNSYREPGMERYWVPSNMESALFGTLITDRFFIINQGSDIAFINGTLKHMISQNMFDWQFVRDHTLGFERLAADLARMPWETLEEQSGVSRDEMAEFAKMVGEAKKAVFVWSMGITQHTTGEDGVRAIINLALSKGFVGREGCGVMPIRGHSGVQGGAEMGAYATSFPGGKEINEHTAAELSQKWGFAVPPAPGLTAPEMLDAAAEGKLDMLFSSGGNFLEVMPDPEFVRNALANIPLRVHMDIVLTNQMLIEPRDMVLLLPATTRYEIPGGVTETSTERRVIYSPEIEGPRIGEARSEIQVFLDLAKLIRPEYAQFLEYADTAAIRNEIGEVIPMYDGIQHLHKAGDQFQHGGPHLCANWQFPTPDGMAHFQSVSLPQYTPLPEGAFRVTTRRGKQFNSMIHEQKDQITGAERDAIFINRKDAMRVGVQQGQRVRLHNQTGQMEGRIFFAPVKSGNLQVHWPEGNVLLQRDKRSCEAGIPDYNAIAYLDIIAEPVEDRVEEAVV
jgi:molybdopterin-dependent oxidoreductase alpha subunit